MIFANPFYFLVLVPLVIWFFWQMKRPFPKEMTLPYPNLSVVRPWIKKRDQGRLVLEIMKLVSFGLMMIALARPQIVSSKKEPPKPVVDILLCLDSSLSMSALDFGSENRLEAAKKAAEEFIRKRSFDRIGLVVFGGRAITQCPLTLDHETLIDLLRSIPMNATQTDGTAIGEAIALASTRLSESEAKTKVIILLTDGRNNSGTIEPLTAASAAGDLGIKIYTIGTAVPGGGLIPVEDPLFGKRLAKMAEDLDEPTLQTIAHTTSARYFRVTSSQRFKEIYQEIDSFEKTKIDLDASTNVWDIYHLFLVPSLLILSAGIFMKNSFLRTLP